MSQSTREEHSGLRRIPTLYGVVLSLIWAIVGAFVVAFWNHFFALSGGQLVGAAYVVHCIAVLFGAFGASRAAAERGWYYGGVTGFIYAIIMVSLSLLVYNAFSFDATGLFRVLLMTLIGAFGGIIGVGTKSND